MRKFFLLLFFFATLPFLRLLAADSVHPFDSPLTLNLWGAGLNVAASDIHSQTGVEILFYLPDLPATTNTDNVFLVTGRVTLGTVMEGLARRFGFRYRLTANGRIECSRGYDWVGARQSLTFVRFDPLVEGGIVENLAFLSELLKPLGLLPGDYSIAIEPYPLPERPNALRCTAVLPQVLGDYLERAIRCLSGDAGDYPPRSDASGLFARAHSYPADWSALLGRSINAPRGAGARALLFDIARQAGVAMILHTPPASPGNLPNDVERYTLGRVTEMLSTLWGLGKRVFLGAGVVLFDRGQGEYETDSRCRELFWDGLAVAGFDAAVAAGRLGGDGLVTLMRREVFPGVWRDPVCSLAFSPVTRRLVVVAPGNVVEAVARRLSGIK